MKIKLRRLPPLELRKLRRLPPLEFRKLENFADYPLLEFSSGDTVNHQVFSCVGRMILPQQIVVREKKSVRSTELRHFRDGINFPSAKMFQTKTNIFLFFFIQYFHISDSTRGNKHIRIDYIFIQCIQLYNYY